ncbi:MAG: hypothetical protein WAL56_07995 [Candidatus Sulfotelmatobacter sp.]
MLDWRNFICGVMIVIGPASLLAQSTDRALLNSDGGTLLNGSPSPNTSTIFRHDLIQTPKGHAAKIDAEGSTVTVAPETLVQFEGDELVLDHGGLELSTARQMKVRVNCITVIPITAEITQFNVTDVDGKVKIAAYQNDVKIHAAGAAFRTTREGESSDSIVRQGEQKTRDEHCGAAARPEAVPEGIGAILNGPKAWITGMVIAGTIACFGLCHGDDPISPWKP